MTQDINIIIAPDVEELGRNAAHRFFDIANTAIRETGQCTIALSGGTTPTVLYKHLLHERDKLDWSKVTFFWSDERLVPTDHPDSNAGLAVRHLLRPLGLDPSHYITVPTQHNEPAHAADAYEAAIQEHFKTQNISRFDLILLGLGNDGHTASLFPNSPALHEKERLVVCNWVKKLESWRITFSYTLLNRAANIMFLVSGRKKAQTVQRVLKQQRPEYPATHIHPRNGRVLWYLDRESGALIGS